MGDTLSGCLDHTESTDTTMTDTEHKPTGLMVTMVAVLRYRG